MSNVCRLSPNCRKSCYTENTQFYRIDCKLFIPFFNSTFIGAYAAVDLMLSNTIEFSNFVITLFTLEFMIDGYRVSAHTVGFKCN